MHDASQVGSEKPVDGAGAEPWNGVTDYSLYRANGEIIAVVEAKRMSRDPRVAKEQIRHYLTEIEMVVSLPASLLHFSKSRVRYLRCQIGISNRSFKRNLKWPIRGQKKQHATDTGW